MRKRTGAIHFLCIARRTIDKGFDVCSSFGLEPTLDFCWASDLRRSCSARAGDNLGIGGLALRLPPFAFLLCPSRSALSLWIAGTNWYIYGAHKPHSICQMGIELLCRLSLGSQPKGACTIIMK